MKKISVLVCISLFSFACAYSQPIKPKIFDIPPVKPKKPVPPAKPKKTWYFTFEMTIKGAGSVKNLDNSGNILEWGIDRSYSGVIALDQPAPSFDHNWSQAEISEAFRSGRKVAWFNRDVRRNSSIDDMKPSGNVHPVAVRINDMLRTITKENDEGDTFENTTITTHWEFDDSIFTSNSNMLVFDKKLGTYNVHIPLVSENDNDPYSTIRLQVDTSIERSDHGYGDLPTSESGTFNNLISFNKINFPTIKNLLENGFIHHEFDLPLPAMKDVSYQYDPGDLQPDKPMFGGVPESKTKVKIHIYYLFKQLTD